MKSFTLALIALCGTAFGQSTSTTQPPVERIGVNDVLAVSVHGAAAMPQSLRVGSAGCIQLRMLAQPVKAAGLLPQELEGEIARALQIAAVVADARVTVAVSEFHSRPVSVIGAVNHPALFQASGDVTLREALERAEGLTPEAGGEILLSHPRFDGQGVPVQRILVKALLDNSDPALNVVLSGGEDIRVPEAQRIFVSGNVTKPGIQAPAESARDFRNSNSVGTSDRTMMPRSTLSKL